jgi:hypothetical protein
MQPGSGGGDPEQANPVARMMMSVAGQAITAYVQFQALAELLIAKGVISREELEHLYAQMRDQQLERTIDEWFPADIAYHIKLAMQPAEASATADEGTAVPSDVDEIARARAMQSFGQSGGHLAGHAGGRPDGQSPEQ